LANPKDRVTNNLVALGSAAVFTVYAAGFVRTRPAAQRFAQQAERRPTPVTRIAAATPAAESTAADSVATPVPAAQPAPVANVPAPTPAPAPAPASPTPARDSSRNVVAPAAPAADSAPAGDKDKARLKDGIFFGWGTSRHGDIQAGIEIKNGRIISAFISECLTQYSCSWIQMLPSQVIARQSADVDFVSGATQSTNAFYYAVTDALKKAK
jgi:uncharacterized protein with FMN-binding domain